MENELINIAIRASLEAGAAIMEIYQKPFDVELKEDRSPLTQADKASNSNILSHLEYTNIPIISEESRQTDYAIRSKWSRCWIVDPLDGTKEFVKRNGEFTVNIALVEDQVPILGVIYVPVTKELYFANVREGKSYKAQLTAHNDTLEQILESAKTLNPNTAVDTIRVVGSRSHMSQETLDYMEQLKTNGKTIEVVSKGSSLKFCLLAEGLADAYPRFAPTMEWDTAAGHAICNAVGIEVISKETDLPLLYNKENLLNPWFLASKR
ncbi:MAG TPA: 3'(2'),5'-bisphosphate nucleotidase CysQ [Aquaticitalea sp.]|nr:3'(2'),5'-bisphosphate nucleotidase CysQ [Aquaticitalea sp.]HNU58355.1 3'(2'),5'-bisphosphate nucleotidase CysQ [Aquaticitalea sp.]